MKKSTLRTSENNIGQIFQVTLKNALNILILKILKIDVWTVLMVLEEKLFPIFYNSSKII
jgi:hypothetical protein